MLSNFANTSLSVLRVRLQPSEKHQTPTVEHVTPAQTAFRSSELPFKATVSPFQTRLFNDYTFLDIANTDTEQKSVLSTSHSHSPLFAGYGPDPGMKARSWPHFSIQHLYLGSYRYWGCVLLNQCSCTSASPQCRHASQGRYPAILVELHWQRCPLWRQALAPYSSNQSPQSSCFLKHSDLCTTTQGSADQQWSMDCPWRTVEGFILAAIALFALLGHYIPFPSHPWLSLCI